MAYEKTNMLNTLNRVRGCVSADKYINLYVACAYEELCSRGEITSVFGMDSKTIISEADETALKNTRSELKKMASEDIRGGIIDFINGFSVEAGKMGADFSSIWVCKLAIELLELSNGDSIYDLGSGSGFFLANALKHSQDNDFVFKDIYGLDINPQSVNVSKMILSILGNSTHEIRVGNIFEYLRPAYNKAFSFPPLNMKMPELVKTVQKSSFGTKFSSRSNFEWLFVDRMISGLIGNNQKAVAVLAPNCLYNEADKEYRDALLESGSIETIVELPAGTLNATSIRCCVVVFSRGNKEVKVVDASDVLGPDPTRFMHPELPIKQILEKINTAPKMVARKLKESDTLMPSQLLVREKVVDVKGSKLSDNAEVFPGCQYTVKNFESMFSNENTGYRILTSSDIVDGTVEWEKLQFVKYEDTKFDKYAVKKDDIVITSKSSKVKICVVDVEPKDKILVTGGMIIVRPNTSKLNPVYLKLYLDSANGRLAIKAIQRGMTIISLNAKDLQNIVIPDVSIEKQNLAAKKYMAKLSTYIALREELKNIQNSLNNLYSDEFEGE